MNSQAKPLNFLPPSSEIHALAGFTGVRHDCGTCISGTKRWHAAPAPASSWKSSRQ